MAEKPTDWDPQNPPDRICIFCYGSAPFYAVWKYGVNCVCWEGKCRQRTNGMIGFKYAGGRFTQGGLFRIKSEADRAFDLQEIDRRAKEANPRAK